MQTDSITRAQPAALAPALPFDPAMLAGQLAPSSIAMYRRDYLAYLAFAGSPAAALDPVTLARWRAVLAQDSQLSPNTINRMLSAVKRVTKEAAQQGYLAADVAAAFQDVPGVKVVALKERVKPHARTRIAPADMRRLCDAPSATTLKGIRDRALLSTLASSGVRVSEAASLQREQIVTQGSGYLVRVRGKNDLDYRLAPLSLEAYQRIQTWLQARPVTSEYLFTRFAGRGETRAGTAPMTAQGVWLTVQAYAAALGLAFIKPHDFRRFVGTQLARHDIRRAQKALGHKRIDTTARHYVLDEVEPGWTDHLY